MKLFCEVRGSEGNFSQVNLTHANLLTEFDNSKLIKNLID